MSREATLEALLREVRACVDAGRIGMAVYKIDRAIAALTPEPAAPRVGVVAGAFRPPWLVVIKRETYPVEVTPFETEAEAREFESEAGQQWTESYVCKVVKGPLT